MFEGFFGHIISLASNDATVEDDIPCRTDILSVRECDKEDKTKIGGLTLDLLQCMAQYKVDVTEKLRENIGVAKYLEYTKEMEEKYGKEKAAEIIAEPTERLADAKAHQVVYRLQNNQHPKGAPKTKEDLQDWTHADQVRLEMGEKEWLDSVKVVGSEFGPESVERLFGLQKDRTEIKEAVDRVYDKLPDAKKESALEKLKPKQKEFLKTMEMFREVVSGAST
jgi:hypothetical protein